MTQRPNTRSGPYQTAVTAAGLLLWLGSGAALLSSTTAGPTPWFFALVPVIVLLGMFPLHFRLPLGLALTQEKLTFTLADAVVLVIAGWYGLPAAIFAAGVEGLTSSLRTVRRLSSNLFSLSIISFSAAAASASLIGVLGPTAARGGDPTASLSRLCLALLLASIVQMAVNTFLISTLLALRHGRSVFAHWRELLRSAAPMFIPTCSVATILYLSPRYDPLLAAGIAVPVFIAVYVLHRHYRDSIQQQIRIMEKAHRETIEALAVAINAKDEVTHEHVLRVQIYASGVAGVLGCSSAEIEALKAGALLHDIGKIAVPDSILNKPGKLTAAEFEKMKLHTVAGAQILGRVEFPYPIVPVVRHHHERWDGRGYPDGLTGEEIPLTARILSVVDCFDAVREDRQYRKGLTRPEAIALVQNGSGSQYDPRVVESFIANLPTFEAEIEAMRDRPVPTFGIEPIERLSEAATRAKPAAGLAEEAPEEEDSEPGMPRELKGLLALARSLVAERARADLLGLFTERLRGIVPYDLCAITTVDPESGENVVEHAAGAGAETLAGRRSQPGEGVTGWVITNHRPFANVDPRLDLPEPLMQEVAFRTQVVVPLATGGETLGAVSLYSARLASYQATHLKLLEEAAALMAPALAANRSRSPVEAAVR